MRELKHIMRIFTEELLKKDSLCAGTIMSQIAAIIDFKYFHNELDRHRSVMPSTSILTPSDEVKANHMIFLHTLPKGGVIREHAHEIDEEFFICLEGSGILILDGKEHPFKKHDVAYISPRTKHSLLASKSELQVIVMVTPPGLEQRLKLMGKLKTSQTENPPEAFDSAIGKIPTHGVLN